MRTIGSVLDDGRSSNDLADLKAAMASLLDGYRLAPATQRNYDKRFTRNGYPAELQNSRIVTSHALRAVAYIACHSGVPYWRCWAYLAPAPGGKLTELLFVQILSGCSGTVRRACSLGQGPRRSSGTTAIPSGRR